MLKVISKKLLKEYYNVDIKDNYNGLIKFDYSECVREYGRIEESSNLEYLGNDCKIGKEYNFENWLDIEGYGIVENYSFMKYDIDSLIFNVGK